MPHRACQWAGHTGPPHSFSCSPNGWTMGLWPEQAFRFSREGNMKRVLLALSLSLVFATKIHSQPADPNPAMNNSHKDAWELFVLVNKPVATPSNNNVLFETWASNEDTFQPNPKFPGAAAPPSCQLQQVAALITPVASPKILNVPALEALAPRPPGLQPKVVPGGSEEQPSEEVRRNQATFDFIVCNKLHTKAGLRVA